VSAPFEEVAALDRLVHEPARLAVLTALSACKGADFLYLQRLTGLSKGNLSSHLSKLEDAGMVAIEKGFVGKVPNTHVSITAAGRRAIERHWKRLDQLRQAALEWTPELA
jgi:DNA-binding MarR family transcriptional regulator